MYIEEVSENLTVFHFIKGYTRSAAPTQSLRYLGTIVAATQVRRNINIAFQGIAVITSSPIRELLPTPHEKAKKGLNKRNDEKN